MLRVLLCLPLLFAACARTEWLIAETQHFRLHANTTEALIRERAALLEDYRNLLTLMTAAGAEGRAPAPKLDIYLLDDIGDAFPFERTPPDVAGFYEASPTGIAAYADASRFGLDVLLHEYAHHFMLASGSAAYPSWYIEGFAEYFMTAKFTPERVEFGGFNENRATWLLKEDWLPMKHLLARRFERSDGRSAAMFYAQSWLLTHYLFRVEGESVKLRSYLTAVAGGADPEEAFRAHVAPDLVNFQAKTKRYLTSHEFTYSVLQRPAATPASVSVRPAPVGAGALLLPLSRLEIGHGFKPEDVAPVIERAIARAPGSPLAPRLEALLALRMGQIEKAARTLDPLLEASPDDPQLLLWRAEATGAATPEDRAASRRWLARAFRANPDDWRVLRAYVRTQDFGAGPLSQNDLEIILLAYELAPQVPAVAIDCALALALAGRFAEAATVLEPIGASPHGGSLSARVRTLIAALEAADTAAFLHGLSAPDAERPEN